MSITIYATPGSTVAGWVAEQFQTAGLTPAWIATADGSEGLARIQGLGYRATPVIVVENADEISSWYGLAPAKVAAAIQVEGAAAHSRPVFSVAA